MQILVFRCTDIRSILVASVFVGHPALYVSLRLSVDPKPAYNRTFRLAIYFITLFSFVLASMRVLNEGKRIKIRTIKK